MNKMKIGGVFTIVCRDPEGKVKWKEIAKNLVTSVGLQHVLDVVFSAGANVATWYIGLANTTPVPAAGDTLAVHGGWTENANYTGDRKEWVEVRSNQTMSNSASKASFAITVDAQTLGGAFLCSVDTTTTGTLMACAAFTGGDKSADNGDTLEVQYDFTAADDGA